MQQFHPELDTWRPRLAHLAAQAVADQGPDGAHDLNHFERVWRNAQALLAQHRLADPLVVLAACYLHDLVNVPKDDPRRSSASRLSTGRRDSSTGRGHRRLRPSSYVLVRLRSCAVASGVPLWFPKYPAAKRPKAAAGCSFLSSLFFFVS